MKVVVAHSLDPEASHAAEELVTSARSQLDGMSASAGLLYAANDFDHAVLCASVYEALGGIPIIGCTTDGELSGGCGFHEDSAVLVLFASEKITIRAGLGRSASLDPESAARQAIRMASEPGDPVPSLCIVLADGLSSSGSDVTRALTDLLGASVPLVGALAGDQSQFRSCAQVFAGQVFHDVIPVLMFYGPLAVGIGVGSGWRPVGRKVPVTSCEGNVMSRIGGQTAVDFYESFLGENVVLNPEYPLMVYERGGDSSYIRSPLVSRPDGAIQFAGEVPQGAHVCIAEASRTSVVEGCKESARSALSALGGRPPDGALVFSCAARRMVLGTRAHEEAGCVEEVAPGVPFGGFYSYGEIAPQSSGAGSRFHNETFITVFLAES